MTTPEKLREIAQDAGETLELATSDLVELLDALEEARRYEAQCNGLCMTASDVGLPGRGIAYPHLSCPRHGDPAELGMRADILLQGHYARIERAQAQARGVIEACGETGDETARQVCDQARATLDALGSDTIETGGTL